MTLKPGTPVATPHGAARIQKDVRKYGVYLLDRKTGPYWTYPPEQLREISAGELSRLMQKERREQWNLQ